MKTKEVLLVLTDDWADWEASYAVAGINISPMGYTVKTIAADKTPKTSIGGIRAEIDYQIADYQNFDALRMVILPGGYSWDEHPHKEIVDFLKTVQARHIPIAAICGATIFLARNGFFESVKHTGDDFGYFVAKGAYVGQTNFVAAQVVVDNGFITANETAAVEFAHEIFKTLETDPEGELNRWFERFKNGMVQ